MKYSDVYTNKEIIKQIKTAQKVANMVNIPAMQEAASIINSPVVQQAYQSIGVVSSVMESIQPAFKQASILSEFASNNIKGVLSDSMEYYMSMLQMASDAAQLFHHDRFSAYLGGLANYYLIHYHPDDMSVEDIRENEEANNKIVTEIFRSDEKSSEFTDKKESAIITLSPVNDRLLKYLSENPEALYQLTGRKFEEVMAEIYNKLGYKVELTKATKDGGKDIIIRKPEILGDFIYYVECKKYAANNPVGVGIVRELDGVVNMDRVNGGIIATTSYFTKDARDLILDKNLGFKIKLHDYDVIKDLLRRAI